MPRNRPRWLDKAIDRREASRAQYKELFATVEAILFAHDPLGINFEDNTDEYDLEVGTILPRLKECRSAEDVATVVHQEFVRWFDGEDTAGSIEGYRAAANEIWSAWLASGFSTTA